MEEKKLTLRIKSKKSQNGLIKDVSTKQTVGEFLLRLSSLTDVPADHMCLLTGFPPKKLPYDTQALLETCGLVHQDTVIVELDTSGSPGKVSISATQASSGSSSTPSEVSEEEKLRRLGKPSVPSLGLDGSDLASFLGSSSNSVKPSAESEQVSSSAAHKNQHIINALNSSTVKQRDLSTRSTPPASETPSVPVSTPSSSLLNALSSPAPAEGLIPEGMMLRQVVPADNSCLFRSVKFCLLENMSLNDDVSDMRRLIARYVDADKQKFSEAYLGKVNVEYQTWIQNTVSWGGGIELSILSEHHQIEIAVVDIQSLSISRFGEDKNYRRRMVLIYDGIHYDPLYMEPFDGSRLRATFPASDESILDKSLQLAREANVAHQYVDLRNFSLRCGVCNTLIKGNSEATAHAKETGHASFTETM